MNGQHSHNGGTSDSLGGALAAAAVVVAALAGLAWLVLEHPLLLALALVAAAATAGLWWAVWPSRRMPRNRVRYQRWRLRCRLRPGRGHANVFELNHEWSRRAAFRESSRTRPSLGGRRSRATAAARAYSVFLGRAQYRHGVRIPLQEHVAVFAPPRSGKTGWLGTVIARYPGSVISTTTKPDLYQHTSAVRGALGPVHVFNPQGIGAVPSTFAWNFLAGCEDPAVAIRRADAFAQSVSQKGVEDASFWSSKASDYLRGFFFAGALAGLDARHVAVWVAVGDSGEAEEILHRHGALKAAERLSFTAHWWATQISELRGEAQKTAQTVRMSMSRSLAFLADPALAACVLPGPGEGFDIGQFLMRSGTLYLIAESRSDDSPLAALFACLASEIHYTAGLIGSRNPGGRLDPPMLMALDEVTQICPVPVDKWLADSGGKGIQIITVAHGLAQLRERWGANGARVILDTSGAVMLLPGVSDTETLRAFSELCGDVALHDRTAGGGDYNRARVPIMDAAMIRQLPKWRALVLRAGLSPLIVRLPMVWDDSACKRAMRAARRPAVQPATVPAAITAASRLALPAGPAPAQAVPEFARGHVTAADGPDRESVTVPAGRDSAELWWMR